MGCFEAGDAQVGLIMFLKFYINLADKDIAMRVEYSAIGLSSVYNATYKQKNTHIEITRPIAKGDRVDIASSRPINENKKAWDTTLEYKKDDYLTEKQRIARLLIEAMFGVKIPDQISIKGQNGYSSQENQDTPQRYEVTIFDFTEKLEKEDVDFKAEGYVVTSEGKIYNFNASVRLNRSLYEAGVSINRQIQGKDPIVLSLSGVFNGLSEHTIDFDIDADGVIDKIHFVKEGSGFLVIDKNNDRKINDGKEVIGAQSGNAISELSDYDDDKNNWIDEADAVFVKLSVWEKDSSGRDIITPLKDKGIGAICLTTVPTPFQIKNIKGSYGEIFDSGVFLFENSTVSTFHRIDLFA